MSTVKIILQARLNSSRLPGKMLMEVGDVPLIILCAKRVMSSGYSVIVATSLEKSDDPLVGCLEEHDISYVRGPLNDVLTRFLLAAEDMKDEDLIVRLTGDNPFVDGSFVHDIINFHKSADTDYTRSLSPFDRLPYGVSAEVIKAGFLRSIDHMDLSEEDREHVTIYPTKKEDYVLFVSPLTDNFSHLRATIDTPEDYARVSAVFKNIDKDPLTISWQALTQRLQALPDAPAFRTPYKKVGLKAISRLALGTVQLGLNYGISNETGQPGAEEARQILETAIAHGINLIDTAAAYGESEAVIGESLGLSQKQEINIHTKLDPLNDLKGGEIIPAVEASVHRSCERLGLETLPCLMLHRWEHYTLHDGDIWQQLLKFKQDGLIQKLGASVQSPEEALKALSEPNIEFIQLPFNICDWRWRESGFIEAQEKRPDIHIQARSSLLQGVFLLQEPQQWPVLDIASAEELIKSFQLLVKDYNRKSVQDLCYAYVRSMDWVDSVVVGVETLEQLNNNLILFNQPLFKDTEQIEMKIPKVDARFLNPAQWH